MIRPTDWPNYVQTQYILYMFCYCLQCLAVCRSSPVHIGVQIMSERSGVRSPASACIFYFAASSWLFFLAIVSTFCAIYLAPYIPFYSYSRELERRGLFHSYFMLPHRESRRGESKEFRESLAMGNY